jgi:hypothetical protein
MTPCECNAPFYVTVAETKQWLNPEAFVSVVDPTLATEAIGLEIVRSANKAYSEIKYFLDAMTRRDSGAG